MFDIRTPELTKENAEKWKRFIEAVQALSFWSAEVLNSIDQFNEVKSTKVKDV